MSSTECQLETVFIETLIGLKYTHRPDITNRAALEANFRQKFEELNRVHLTDGEFARLLDEIVTPDVFTAALQNFLDGILQRMVFDGEQLSDLMAPLELGWRTRTELALMEDLLPLLTKCAQGRDISGLSAYEQ